jgi:hypothetical protein
MDFKISYEDAKKILAVFYTLPYRNAAAYVDLLQALQEAEGSLSLKDHIEAEVALLNQTANKETVPLEE